MALQNVTIFQASFEHLEIFPELWDLMGCAFVLVEACISVFFLNTHSGFYTSNGTSFMDTVVLRYGALLMSIPCYNRQVIYAP